MKKTILVTGSTDGIGLETAKSLVTQGHHVLIHGRNRSKLEQAEKLLNEISDNASIESYMADLSRMNDVVALAKAITEKHNKLDVLINNAGVYKTPQSITQDGLDARFAVNTIAPYLLTQKLLPLLAPGARIINVSSAAQAPVDADALAGKTKLSDDFNVYAQSKLALTMWSRHMASTLKDKGPVIIAVNPGSLLGTKMVQEGFGIAGKDIRIGADILVRLALDDEFDDANGLYFDNDTGQLTTPHPDAMKPQKTERIVRAIEETLAECDEYD
jgi:NAD(P)-dependent dehydrogenase (short-subunit alcohol dehydrogenase family)